MITQAFTQDTYKLLAVFSLSPGSRFSRTEIKQRTLLNNVPLDKALSRLSASGLVKREGNYYSLNLESQYVKQFIAICRQQHLQLRQIPLKIYFLLMDIVSQVSAFRGVELFLFGSYSKLVYTEKSDVDMAAILPKAAVREAVTKIIGRAAKGYGKEVQIQFFDKGFYRSKKDPLVREILKNGVKLI